MTNSNNKQKFIKYPNPLEALKDIGKSTTHQMKDEVIQIQNKFFEQLLGIRLPSQKRSGEIGPGETIRISEVLSEKQENLVKEKRKSEFIARLEREEKQLLERKTDELRIKIDALQKEILMVAKNTENLAEETEIAAMQVIVDPSEYHVTFFEKLWEFLRSFRKKIESASEWLHVLNKRSAKKNAWAARYAKYGAKYLLSGEHYLQRSAG